MRELRCVWTIGATLGEGPVWSVSDSALWFVDIKSQLIHRFDPATQKGQSWAAPDQVSFILPLDDGSMVAGLPGRLARFEPATGDFQPLLALDAEPPGNRLNDACVDAAGRLWFGSMHDGEFDLTGALYCWDGLGAPVACDNGFAISNGPAHSPDGRTLYHTDTLARTIYRYEVADDGSISGKQPFIQIEAGVGYPDGSAVDEQGCIWVALFGGWAVRRYSPLGELLESVSVPCANVTKLVLGGADLKTAFVTTARIGVRPGELDEQPLAGGLFTFDVDVPGLRPRAMSICNKGQGSALDPLGP